jgi:hypothetical protein
MRNSVLICIPSPRNQPRNDHFHLYSLSSHAHQFQKSAVATPLYRARICNCLWSPGIDSEKSIPPVYVARRAGTKNRVVVLARQAENRFLGSSNGLQIRALYNSLYVTECKAISSHHCRVKYLHILSHPIFSIFHTCCKGRI